MGPMKEVREIAAWIALGSPHELKIVDSLPSPTFQADGAQQVSFSSNNYLSLASSPRLIAAARRGLERYGVGNCESRLLGGNLEIYEALEAKLARLKHKESAVLFATGYLANVGVLSMLPRLGQYARMYGFRTHGTTSYAYFSDEFSHLSIREGIRTSGATRHNFRHGDLDHLEALLKKSEADCRIIVTDGVFSQDGDIADLPGLLALADRYDATVYVDDAHGTGVLGANGGGISEHFSAHSPRLIHMGTLSKAYGAIGGFIATDAPIAQVLRLSCASYGFTSTLPPDQAFAVSEAVDAVRDEPERRRRLWDNQRYFVERMQELSYSLVSTQTPIVPIMIGDEAKADRIAGILEAERIHVDAVKFPAVSLHKARLRVQLNAAHTRAQIDHLVDVLADNQDTVDGVKLRSNVVALPPKQSVVRRPWAAAAFAAIEQKVTARLGDLGARAATAVAKLAVALDLRKASLQTSLNLVTMATAALLAVDVAFDIPHLIWGYLLPIMFVAVKFGRVPAMMTLGVSALCSVFFLYEPVYSLSIEDPQDVAEFAGFCSLGTLMIFFLSKSAGIFAMRRLR
jgi:glycine C-acetyltransferase